MPTPIGHSMFGLGFYLFFKRKGNLIQNLPFLLFILIFTNLPDIDFIPGILIGALDKFHSTYTHTLGMVIFIFVILYIGSRLIHYAQPLRISLIGAGVTYFHILCDALNMDTRPPAGVMLFWPFSRKYYNPLQIFLAADRHHINQLFSHQNILVYLTELLYGISFICLMVVLKKILSRHRGDN